MAEKAMAADWFEAEKAMTCDVVRSVNTRKTSPERYTCRGKIPAVARRLRPTLQVASLKASHIKGQGLRRGLPAEVVGVGHVLRQAAGRHQPQVRRHGGTAGEAAVGGVGVELRHAAGVRVDGEPAPSHRRAKIGTHLLLTADLAYGL
jgi:hypothetical protein